MLILIWFEILETFKTSSFSEKCPNLIKQPFFGFASHLQEWDGTLLERLTLSAIPNIFFVPFFPGSELYLGSADGEARLGFK